MSVRHEYNVQTLGGVEDNQTPNQPRSPPNLDVAGANTTGALKQALLERDRLRAQQCALVGAPPVLQRDGADATLIGEPPVKLEEKLAQGAGPLAHAPDGGRFRCTAVRRAWQFTHEPPPTSCSALQGVRPRVRHAAPRDWSRASARRLMEQVGGRLLAAQT